MGAGNHFLVIIRTMKLHFESADAVPVGRSRELSQGQEQSGENSGTVEEQLRKRTNQPRSDRETEQRHAPCDRPRRKITSTKDTNRYLIFLSSKYTGILYKRLQRKPRRYLF